jgi:hypothetical protein
MRGRVSLGTDFDPTSLLEQDTQNEATETDAEPSEDVEGDVETPPEVDTGDETVTENTEPDVDSLKSEVETYKNRYSNLEKLLGKQSQELGELRKFYQDFQKNQSQSVETDEGYVDAFIKNPKQAIQQEIARRDAESQQARIQENESVTTNLNQIYQAVPNFDQLKETILEIAKNEDGIAQADMNMLEITLKTDPLYAIMYAKRAQLKQQLEATKSNGKKVVDQLSKNSQRPQPVKAGVPSVSKDSLSSEDIANMSDKELKIAMKKYGLV